MEKASSSELPTHSHTWTSIQRFELAALCACIVTSSSWSGNDAEKAWKRRFLASIFRHLAVDDKREQEVLLRISEETGDISIDLLLSSFKQQLNNDERQGDIREEIICDMIITCLGLSPSNLNNVDKQLKANDNSEESLNLKEKLDDVISNVIGKDSSTVMPAEYDSRSRAILFKLAWYLEVSPFIVRSREKSLAQYLYFLRQQQLEAEKDDSQDDHEIKGLHICANESLNEREKRKKKWRWMATGVGVVVGATAIGLTGGLAAPLVAPLVASIGAITGASIVVTAATSVALMTSLFGIAGGGLAGYKMHKRTQGLKEFAFTRILQDESLPLIPSLHVNIVISGYYLEDTNEATTPWLPTFQNGANYSDTFALSFDTEILRLLGRSFWSFLAETAVKTAANLAIQQTVFAALANALTLPAALMKVIDNPWALGADRAQKAGLVLADVLIERVQGKRPTVLIGYSLGALVIWHCLLELAKKQQYGLIDTVVLIGAPITSTQTSKWKDASSIVSRRFVNAYATNDVVLGLIYRMHSLDLNVAGLCAVDFDKVENYDITKFTSGHLGYCDPDILTKILKEIKLD